MRPNFNHNTQKNTQQIQMHIAQKQKSRNKLIGSFVILLCSAAILLTVTSNVKQINVTPKVVEIKNTAASEVEASSPVAIVDTNASNPISNNNSSEPLVQPQVMIEQPKTEQTNASAGGFRAGVVSKTTTNHNSNITIEKPQKTAPIDDSVVYDAPVKAEKSVKQKIKPENTSKQPQVQETIKNKQSSPEDILDGISDGTLSKQQKSNQKTVVESKGSSYIQFAALSSEENANQLKQKLASIGVNATIKQIHTQKGTLYRLRAGPFSKETAENKLHQVKSNGLSGIITGS